MRWRCPQTGALWCPLCYEGLRGRRSHKGHSTCIRHMCKRARRKRVWFMLKKRSSDNGQSPERPPSCRLTESLPSLAEFLAEVAWPDGSPRQTGTLMVFVEDGRWKGWLHDRDQSCSCFVSNTTLSNLLSALDAGLADEGLEWRPDRPRGSPRAGR